MGYIVAALMVLLGVFRKKSKFVTYLYSAYMWALIALNTYTADMEAYKEMYLCCFEPRYSGHEIGYMTICRICLSIGLSYTQFRMIIAAIIVVFVISGLKYYTSNINYALSLFLLFPFAGNVSGLRNGVGMALFIYASHFLLQDDRKSTFRYVLLISIAMLFHYNSVFYFIFLFVKYKRIKTLEMMVGIVAAIAAVILFAQIGVLYNVVSIFTNSEKVLDWFRTGKPYMSPLYILTFLCFIVWLWLFYRARMIASLREKTGGDSGGKQTRDSVLRVAKIVALSLLSFSGAIFRSVVFLRYVLVPLPICYAVFSDVFIAKSIDSLGIQNECRMIRFILPVCVLCVALFVYGYWIGGNTLQVYQNNLLFSWM